MFSRSVFVMRHLTNEAGAALTCSGKDQISPWTEKQAYPKQPM